MIQMREMKVGCVLEEAWWVANPKTKREVPRVETVVEIPNSFATVSEPAEKTELAKVTTNVIIPKTIVTTDFFKTDQFCGFAGLAALSQSTELGPRSLVMSTSWKVCSRAPFS